jgi:hypothetical protein
MRKCSMTCGGPASMEAIAKAEEACIKKINNRKNQTILTISYLE